MSRNRFTISPATALAAVAIALALPLSACDSSSTDPDPGLPNIVETAQSAGAFNTLLAALDAAGLTETIAEGGPFTVFAPTDDAFADLPAGVIEALLADTDLLTAVLTYHVVTGAVGSSAVVGLSSVSTLNGATVAVSVQGGEVFLNDSRVVTPDVEADNGVIHVIDRVLIPGVVLDLLQTAERAGGFSTLLAAVDAAGLAGVLRGDGPFTIFAPTDAAFAQIPTADLEALLANPEALAAILTYHVVAGELFSGAVVAESTLSTVNGASLQVTVNGGAVKINDANIVAVDVQATNGVIHVIDAVLLPPQD
jgi:transforming growth factor-beta-induced protein